MLLKPSAEDRKSGKLHEVKRKIKEEFGKATGDPDLEVSGKAEKEAGKVQKADRFVLKRLSANKEVPWR